MKLQSRIFIRGMVNELGVSLIEVILAMAILSVLALGTMSLFVSQQKGLETVVSKYERTAVIEDIRDILGDPLSCLATLGGRSADSTAYGAVTDIIQVRGVIDSDNNGNGVIDEVEIYTTSSRTDALRSLTDLTVFQADSNENTATPYGNRKVKILGFALQSSQSIGNSSKGFTELKMRVVTPGGTYVRDTVKSLRINVRTDDVGNIVECGAGQPLGLSLKKVCDMLGGTFYASGSYISFIDRAEGDCFNLNLLPAASSSGPTLRVDGDLTVSHGGDSFSLVDVTIFNVPQLTTAGEVTRRAVCETLGGRFNGTLCNELKVHGYIRVSGDVAIGGEVNFEGNRTSPFPPVSSSSDTQETSLEEICEDMLRGVYEPAGRNGSPNCGNIKVNELDIVGRTGVDGGLSVSGDIDF